MIRQVSWEECRKRAFAIVDRFPKKWKSVRIYGVPRGGIPVALMVESEAKRRSRFEVEIVERVSDDANVVVDDVIDSGKTRDEYQGFFFSALFDKTAEDQGIGFISFPWERMSGEDSGVEDSVVRMLQYIGEDPGREGLLETPKRVVKAWDELFSGYKQNPEDFLKVFEDDTCDEMVILKDVEFTSWCEHHLLEVRGVGHVAYVPDGRIIGLSKLARILDMYAKRLQVQERLTQQVTDCLMEHLKPKGAACVIQATHSCMACRGTRKVGATMITSSLTGVFRDDARARSEFLSMIR